VKQKPNFVVPPPPTAAPCLSYDEQIRLQEASRIYINRKNPLFSGEYRENNFTISSIVFQRHIV
jgi:hypothetical protein